MLIGVEVPFLRDTEVDDRAAKCRKKLAPGVPVDAALDFEQVLDKLEACAVPLQQGEATIRWAVEDLPRRFLGSTRYERDGNRVIVALSNNTYAGLERDGASRFTAAHEIGHLRLHAERLVTLTQLPHNELALARSLKLHSSGSDSEHQANRFAAAFLAPDDGLKLLARSGRLNARAVMNTFGMSRSAAESRIKNYLDAKAYRERDERRRRRKGGR